jgi:anti-sigma regulatory factor (Ser/Thr protein kinase)
MTADREIQFLDSYSASTAVVPEVITRLMGDLGAMKFPQMEIDEIIIAVDEALTNAIQGTLKKQEGLSHGAQDLCRSITVWYRITPEFFDATIIDHGCGLDILKSLKIIPDRASRDYHDQVQNYARDAAHKKIRLTVNGREIALKGIGAGIKIIIAFMDSISIDLFDRKDVLSSAVSEFTDGTILTITRKRRY